MFIGLHVQYIYFYPILMKLEYSRQIFEKYSDVKFHENPSNGSRVAPCGRKDRNGKANSHSFIPLARAECDDSLPFSEASSTPLCYVIFPTTLLHQLFFHRLSPHLAFYFLVYFSVLLFPYSYIIPFWELNKERPT